jgi:hypothetical protein
MLLLTAEGLSISLIIPYSVRYVITSWLQLEAKYMRVPGSKSPRHNI